MTTATVPETIERVFKPIQQFTRGWMMSEATDQYGIELGMRNGTDFLIVGRAGVLGNCTAEVAAAALAFHGESDVFDAWANIPSHLAPADVAQHYVSRVTSWGSDALAEFDNERLEVIDTLGRRIIDAAPGSLGVIFAGWRHVDRGTDLGARVALTTQVLREMRGAAHIVAVHSCGLTPLDAILASTNELPRTGPGHAEEMGFVGPFRDPEGVREARQAAEVLTAKVLEPYFAALSGEELATFGEVVETTRNAIDM